MNKKQLSEQDICNKYITPAIKKAGWKENQFRYEYAFTDGNVIVRGVEGFTRVYKHKVRYNTNCNQEY